MLYWKKKSNWDENNLSKTKLKIFIFKEMKLKNNFKKK